MTISQSLFYLFAAVATLGGTMVILSKNPVRAVLCLVLTFFSTAALWLMLEAEFLAVVLVLVYVGAVMVLFLFTVMMLDIEVASLKQGFTRYLPAGLCIAVLVAICLVYGLGSQNFGLDHFPLPASHPASYSNISELGKLLFTKYLYPFELAGVLLLVAIVSAINLTFRGAQRRKTQDPNYQIHVKKEERVRLLKMAAEQGNL